jgi:four helix bundle protein
VAKSEKVSRFEELVAWQKSRELTKTVYRLTRSGELSRDFELRGQIRRAAISVPSNIAEGFERGRLREFHQALSVAKASCAEVRAQLYIAFDAEYIDELLLKNLLAQAEEVGRVIGGLRKSVALQLRTQHSGLRTFSHRVR